MRQSVESNIPKTPPIVNTTEILIEEEDFAIEEDEDFYAEED